MSTFNQERIIAIDLRLQTIGFFVFEGEGRVLDWGVRTFQTGDVGRLRAVVDQLLAEYIPDAIVLRRRIGTDAMFAELGRVAGEHRAMVHAVTLRSVKSLFPGRRNKARIASAICDRFPELLPFLPPNRKPWIHEDYRMRIFDAAAHGIAYFGKKHSQSAFTGPALTRA